MNYQADKNEIQRVQKTRYQDLALDVSSPLPENLEIDDFERILFLTIPSNALEQIYFSSNAIKKILGTIPENTVTKKFLQMEIKRLKVNRSFKVHHVTKNSTRWPIFITSLKWPSQNKKAARMEDCSPKSAIKIQTQRDING